MASAQDPFHPYPREVRSRTQPPFTRYTRLSDHYAVHHLPSDSEPAEEAIVTLREGERLIEIFAGKADEHPRGISPDALSPVYALQPGDALAVPTGQVFIRFKENVSVEDRRREIERAGYEIAQQLDYAPQAAWLRARSNQIADALTGLPALEKITDVENVEPQMLSQRASR